MKRTLNFSLASILCFFAVLVSFILVPLNSFAETGASSTAVTSTNVTPTAEVTPPPQQGSTKIDPAQIQKALAQAGYYRGPVDGVLGPKTRRAVRAFQEANGLTVDGKCGSRTWEKLKSYLTESAPPSDALASTSTSSASDSLETTLPPTTSEAESNSTSGNLKQKLVS